jgi:hypothetical protein
VRAWALVVAFAVTACAPIPPDERTLPVTAIAADLRLNSSELAGYYRCFHTVSPKGASSAVFQESVYLRVKDRLVFARSDRSTGRYAETASVPFAAIKAVRMHRHGYARQIHVETESGLHTMVLLFDESRRVHIPVNEAEFSALVKSGIPSDENAPYVSNANRGMVVPVLVR